MTGWDFFTYLCAIFLGSSGVILLSVFLRDSFRSKQKESSE
jgi:hypothetical protein